MAYAKPTKPGLEESQEQIHKIRITLSSKHVKNLEKVCADLVRGAKDKHLRVKGPVRIPTKVLNITTRKTPCGEDLNFGCTRESLTSTVPRMLLSRLPLSPLNLVSRLR
ncbi:unnamed protein product [Trifolium pratense]|uniref:Uncharacterized protein n=1 Tax=Trifolium pratense TaxID=57577 RepID=A0ACB0LPH0_TRIPR|nr:unnamed protein product [Trifolium pratense]